MKKVIGLTIALVCLVMMVLTVNATADEMAYGTNQDMAYDQVREWCRCQFYDHYYSNDVLNDVVYDCGALDAGYFEQETGKEWSFENWIEQCLDEFGMTKIEVRKVGEVNETDVYNVYAESNDNVYYKYDEETHTSKGYKKATIMFMVFRKESKEAYMEGKANSQATVYFE